ncbi:MAG: 50S ribosomal protein L17 [Synergistaceae bacterium]|nr:50S ribosomal protein L17 [Synergistaceae bacterium]
MRHHVDHRTLGRYGSHRKLMLGNMAASLFLNGSITTTVTRAKELRRVAEKLITRAKGGSVHDIRVVFSKMPHKEAATKLFAEIAPKYKSFDKGGYTRIVKLGARKGDGSPMAVIELVNREQPAATTTEAEQK